MCPFVGPLGAQRIRFLAVRFPDDHFNGEAGIHTHMHRASSAGMPLQRRRARLMALPALSRLRRGRRWWCGPVLDQATIRPALIRLALALHTAAQPVVVALDTTRLGCWEVWVAGLVVAGRSPRLAGPCSRIRGPKALPGHNAGVGATAPGGLPGRGALDLGSRSRLPQRRAACPVAPGWHRLQRAPAAQRLSHKGPVYATVAVHLGVKEVTSRHTVGISERLPNLRAQDPHGPRSCRRGSHVEQRWPSPDSRGGSTRP